MLELIKIAVTGGIASGKTTVCSYFKECGAYVVYTDEIAHNLLSPKNRFGQKVIELLGTDILEEDQFNRKKIAKKIFNDPKTLEAFEKIIHPEIISTIENLYFKVKNDSTYLYFVVDIPLVFELKQENFYDYIICVIADEKICEYRFEQKGYEKGQYQLRMKRQLPVEEKAKRSDFVIKNDKDYKKLKNESLEIINIIKKKI